MSISLHGKTTLGRNNLFCYESCPRCRIDHSTSCPAVQCITIFATSSPLYDLWKWARRTHGTAATLFEQITLMSVHTHAIHRLCSSFDLKRSKKWIRIVTDIQHNTNIFYVYNSDQRSMNSSCNLKRDLIIVLIPFILPEMELSLVMIGQTCYP